MTEHETIWPQFPRVIYENWIRRAGKESGFARPAQVERYRQALEWYDQQEEIRAKSQSIESSIPPPVPW